MGTDLKIYEQNTTYINGRRRKQFDEICTVWGSELIEEIMEKGQKNWYISSECGAEFELLGSEIIEMNSDYLSRQPYLDLLKSIIENQKDNQTGYSFAIDGEWGSGKTWILHELEKQLLEEKDNKYLIFHYNAWENDFYDEPLVAILSVIIEALKLQNKSLKEKGSLGKIFSSSITTLTKIAGSIIEAKYN